MLPDIITYSLLFAVGFIAIYLLADYIIDTLEEISESFSISPIVLGLLILGIDLEEGIVSLTAAVEGLPYLALGNLIGNTVIAIGIAFGLPALYLKAEIDQLPRFYYVLLVGSGGIVLLSMVLPSYLLLFGLFCMALFTIYLAYTIQIHKEFKSVHSDAKQTELALDQNENRDEEPRNENRLWSAIKLLLALSILFVGAEALVFSAEKIVQLTGLTQTFFGLVIMAAVTNVEEFWLIVKSIKKDRTEIGVSAQVGKIIWNLTLIYGLCSLFLYQFTFDVTMLLSSIIFIIALMFLSVNLFQNRSTKVAGLGYLLLLIIFIALNSILAF